MTSSSVLDQLSVQYVFMSLDGSEGEAEGVENEDKLKSESQRSCRRRMGDFKSNCANNTKNLYVFILHFQIVPLLFSRGQCCSREESITS